MFIKTHIPCPDTEKCHSSDAAALDDKGAIYCFSCKNTFYEHNHHAPLAQTPTPKPAFSAVENLIITGEYVGCPERGITAETAKLYKALHTAEKVYYGYYSAKNPTQIIAAKMRYPDKRFPWVGETKGTLLFGQQLFPSGGKYVTITEGEEDAMAAYQLLGSKYPVVSIANGAQAALANCKASYEWLDSYECIVISFDGDEPGRAAAKEVAALFGGKAKVMKHPEGLKDACDYYKAGRASEFSQAWWRAERFTPDGIISGESLREALKTPVEAPTLLYPWEGLNKMLRGIRDAELVCWTAGSGVGKSSILREIVYHALRTTDREIGLAFLEETPERTMRGIAGLHLNKPIHLDGVSYEGKDIDDAYDTLGLGQRIHLWEHWGSSQIDNVISRLKFFAKALNSRILILDHISIVVSGDASQNERQVIDELMTRLRTEVVQQTHCSLHIVSHLTRPDGKPLENGAPVHLGLLRGSGAIAQLSDVVIAAERNSQADDELERNTVRIRVLKSRITGKTGVATNLLYDNQTGRMTEIGNDI